MASPDLNSTARQIIIRIIIIQKKCTNSGHKKNPKRKQTKYIIQMNGQEPSQSNKAF